MILMSAQAGRQTNTHTSTHTYKHRVIKLMADSSKFSAVKEVFHYFLLVSLYTSTVVDKSVDLQVKSFLITQAIKPFSKAHFISGHTLQTSVLLDNKLII